MDQRFFYLHFLMKKLTARQIEYFIKSLFGGRLQPVGESASHNQRGPSSSDLGLESLGTWRAGGQVAAGESQPRFRSEPGPGVAGLCRALWLLELLLVFSNLSTWFCLCWVFAAASRLSLVAAIRAHSLVAEHRL